jgi:hypothetical protein
MKKPVKANLRPNPWGRRPGSGEGQENIREEGISQPGIREEGIPQPGKEGTGQEENLRSYRSRPLKWPLGIN